MFQSQIETSKRRFSPLVSIYMPTYNRDWLLVRAIESVLNQTYKNFELIIVDDGSTDDTHNVLEKYASHDQRIRWCVKPKSVPRGACASRNLAINKATGRFVTGLDDDDYFCPNRLMDFVDQWRDGLLGLYSDIINEKNKVKRKIRRPKTTSARKLLEKNIITQMFLELETLKNIGNFDEKFPIWQDFELWFRMLRNSSKKVTNTGTASYVVCLDNDYYRISHKKLFTIERTFILFCRKHKLNQNEKRILLIQIFKYFPRVMPWRYWLSVFCDKGSIVFFGEIFKISLKKILSYCQIWCRRG